MSKKRLPFFIFWITQSKISQFQQFLVLIRRLLGPEATATLISAFVLSRLDYCNAVLASLLKVTIAPLQRVQNAAARLILGYILISTITWLQHSTTSTGYLFNTGLPINYVYLCTSFTSKRRHPISKTLSLRQPWMSLKFGQRCFSCAAPATWNTLPPSLQQLTNTDS